MLTDNAICFHEIAGVLYSAIIALTWAVVIAFSASLCLGFYRALGFSMRTALATCRFKKELDTIAREICSSELTGRPGDSCRLKVFTHVENSAFTLGFLKPEVYLSLALVKNLTPAESDIVVRHERMHCAYRDPLKIAMLKAFSEIFWFIPAIRFAERKYRLDSEYRCDRNSIEGGYCGIEVAKTIVRVAELGSDHSVNTYLTASAFNDFINPRICNLLGTGPKARIKIPRKSILLSLVLIAILTCTALTAVAFRTDPGGFISGFHSISGACENGHLTPDFLREYHLNCPHCGENSPHPYDESCHG